MPGIPGGRGLTFRNSLLDRAPQSSSDLVSGRLENPALTGGATHCRAFGPRRQHSRLLPLCQIHHRIYEPAN